MTPLIQAMRTIVHLGETVPEAEQARRPRRPGLAVCSLVAPLPGIRRKPLCVWLCECSERLTAV
jgi:hypothetical protein